MGIAALKRQMEGQTQNDYVDSLINFFHNQQQHQHHKS